MKMKRTAMCIGIVGLLLLTGCITFANASEIQTKNVEDPEEVVYSVDYYLGDDRIELWDYLKTHAVVKVYDDAGELIRTKTSGILHVGGPFTEWYEICDLDSYRGKEIRVELSYKNKLVDDTGLVLLPESGSISGDFDISIISTKNRIANHPIFLEHLKIFPRLSKILEGLLSL